MQRRLIVMRHAKSSWTSSATSDHERPLNGRGRKDAPRIAAALHARGWWPDAVVSSDATRTRETWALMAAADVPEVADVRFEPGLYHAGWREVHASAATWPQRWETVLLLGHNPGWEALAARLSDVWAEMTTANAALLTCEAERWIEALEGQWELEETLRPKELTGL